MMETLTKSEDYVGDEIDELDDKITTCYAMLLKIASRNEGLHKLLPFTW